MLEQLFGSRTRDKLLKLFLENPERQFFVRELTREINERINSVRRELDNLTKFGLLTSKQVDQKRYYQASKDFVLFDELTALIKKSKLLIEKVVAEKVKKLDGLRYLALTGRFVEDESIPTDVLLVGKISKEALKKFIGDLEKIYQKEIRYTYLTTHEFNIRKEVTDKFLYSILNSKKVILVNKIEV
ncbi:hypothetical protein KJ840_05535 [Patescibacteria group bacterium]|nr:hypothetical protein [Patescibacteria group bacterium]